MRTPHCKSPEEFKKPNVLPGFQNAFMHSTPLRLSQRHVDKGKQREIEDVLGADSGVASFRDPMSSPISPTRYPQDADIDVKLNGLDFLEESDATIQQEDMPNRDMDIDMVEATHNAVEETEEVDIIEPLNWKTEVSLNFTYFSIILTTALLQLNRIILMHSLPSSATLTFQILLGTPVTSFLPTDLAMSFSSACARVLEVVASTSKHIDFGKAAERVAQSLVSMVPILNIADSVSYLGFVGDIRIVIKNSFCRWLPYLTC